MPIEFSCSQCGKQLRTPDETAGRKAKCPECGAVTPIPLAAAFAPMAEFAQAMPSAMADAARHGASGSPDGEAFDFNPYASPTTTAAVPLGYAPVATRHLASRGTRFIGHIVDSLIYGVAAVPGFVMAVVFADDRPRRPGGGDDLDFMAGMGFLVVVLALLAVAVVNWVMIAQSGQSLAKKLLGMRIERMDGSPPGFVYGVLLRSWVPGFIGLFFGALWAFADSVAIFSSERRCIHDHLAGTRVVDA